MFRWPVSSPAALPHGAASAESLAVLRAWIFGFWLVKVVARPLTEYGRTGPEGFRPLSLLRALPDGVWHYLLERPDLLLAAQIVLVGVVVAALAGAGGRAGVAAAAIGVLVHQGMARGYTHVNHAQLPMLYATVVLVFAPCTDALRVGRRLEPPTRPAGTYQLPLVGILALMLLTYLLIGSQRLVHGGPELFLSGDLQDYVVRNNLVREPTFAWVPALFETAWFWPIMRAGFPLVTLLELSAPLVLFLPRYRVFFAWNMIGVHTMIWVTMGISFLDEVLLYLVLVDSRRWSPVHHSLRAATIVFFDGFCSLCDTFVSALLPRDRRRVLRFAPLQGATARERLGIDLASGADPDTVVVQDGEGVWQESAAAIRAVSALGGRWSWVAVLGMVPRWISDRVYRWVARNRFRWFPRRESCRLPSPEERAAFLP